MLHFAILQGNVKDQEIAFKEERDGRIKAEGTIKV